MRLIIAEKPSVALDIAHTLGQTQKHEGYVTVGSDAITWAYGHLVTLASPEQYDPTWKTWSWATLPMLPDRFQLTAIPKTQAQLKIVLGLMTQADRIVNACDSDREGESIFRLIHSLSGVKKPVDRLWLSENTPAAIRKALASMKPAKAYDDLAKAALARAQADWLVGLNATRAFSLRHGQPGQPLSVGRVQTPTLKIIVDRDLEIGAFKPIPYWELHVLFQAPAGDYTGIWQSAEREHPARILTEAQANAIGQKVPPGTPGHIDRVEKKQVSVKAPFLFNLNDLQKEANRRLGLTAQQTLDAAQSLYDQHLTSYPRTEARVITTDIAKTVSSRLAALTVGSPALRAQAQAELTHRLPRIVNDAAVAKAGHYAIIPTGHTPTTALSARDQGVYDLIARRFLAALLPPGQDERTTIWTVATGERFKTTGTVVLDPGWRAALTPVKDSEENGANDADSEAESAIPPGLRSGEAVSVLDTDIKKKETKPPARLTDASLLALMEKYGLGTSATRARILEVLLTREYIRRQKKTLVSTDKGQRLLRVLPETLQSPDLTGAWEARLEAIAEASDDPRAFLGDIRQFTQDVVDAARHQTGEGIHMPSAFGQCPLCKKGEIRESPKGWGCSEWKDGCRFMIWKTVAGKKLTATQVKTLLAGKTTAVIKGFKSKAGKSFDARLKLDGPDGRVAFEFETRATASAKSSQPKREAR
ncbi:type IA DNA topoisomerase [Sulfobacillus harzensis]|uniref:DNA topoisomerase n=1 Tax=Sulfobacillus harzensis TaxID=2729629 RepID=A0A7Y0Q1Z8_9FIRM|nr:type IA DNA topoisomerase [Sulfobacillus harzensis]NMP22638.1 DNA topoisomerase 3 [Sulfobacillus harzensis]